VPVSGQIDATEAQQLARAFVGEREVRVEEIGDGNLNVVYRVAGPSRSVIVKQAPPYLRVVGDAWPLTQDRVRIESEALRLHGELATGRVPELLHVDLGLAAMVLEDLSEHTVWRASLIEGVHVPGIAEQIGAYCARTLLGTSDLLMDSEKRKALSSSFVNPELCSITEELVFTDPYLDAESNNVEPAAAPLAAQLWADLPMRRAASRLLWEFRTRHEALIHGDLHTGSIMVAPGDARVIDHEFAFFGPMGYDTGNVVANLAFSSIAHREQGHVEFAGQVSGYAQEFWNALVAEVRELWPRPEPWAEIFLGDLLRDTGRYAATELVRRIVGLAHVADIDSLEDDLRLRAQRRCIAAARSVVLGPAPRTITDLWTRLTTEEN